MTRRLLCAALVLATTACGASGATETSTSAVTVSQGTTPPASDTGATAPTTAPATASSAATSTTAEAPSSTSAPVTSAPSSVAPTSQAPATGASGTGTKPSPAGSAVGIDAVERAASEARRKAPAAAAAPTGQLHNWLKAVCTAHLSGVPESVLRDTVAAEAKASVGAKAQDIAGPVVQAARTHMCP